MRAETAATSIPRSVRVAVWLRDGGECIICRRPVPVECACAHIVRRSQGGLGIEKNVVTLCPICHRELDEGKDADVFMAMVLAHIKEYFPDWKREQCIYHKGGNNEFI